MSERKSFLLRVDREILDAVQRWAGDDLRSLNGQIEFLLRKALAQSGRLGQRTGASRQIDNAASDDAASDDAASDSMNNTTHDSDDVREDPPGYPRDVDATGEP